MENEKILIVEPDSKIAELAVLKLSNAGYLVITANENDALKKIFSSLPDLIIINPSLPQNKGYNICMEILKNPETSKTPVILLVDQYFNETWFHQLNIRPDNCLTKPFSPKVLLNKVNSLITGAKLAKIINPLTELPGKPHLQEAVKGRLADGRVFSLIFCDLKNFKIFNQIYGFEKGNEIIYYLEKLLSEEFSRFGLEPVIHHLGGDDFCVLLDSTKFEEVCRAIIERFDREILDFYPESDRARGGSILTNRRGMIEQWPLLAIAIAVVSTEHRKINSWLEAETIAHELMRYLKTMPGSRFAKDRRCR
ncbi:MAG: diguanylate cyclase [Firmicutes bacterium]|nr:diguanylate cyclase [Bacillota bacterium]